MTPLALINISVLIHIATLVPLIIDEVSFEDVSVEEGELASDLVLSIPRPNINSSISKPIGSLAVLGSFKEVSFVGVFVGILKPPFPMR